MERNFSAETEDLRAANLIISGINPRFWNLLLIYRQLFGNKARLLNLFTIHNKRNECENPQHGNIARENYFHPFLQERKCLMCFSPGH
jgi:hypothetical protein